VALSVAISLATLWIAIAAAYEWNLPVGFLVGTLSGLSYAVGRASATWQHLRQGGRTVLEVT